LKGSTSFVTATFAFQLTIFLKLTPFFFIETDSSVNPLKTKGTLEKNKNLLEE